MDVTTSDHKPVVAHFTLSAPPMPQPRASLAAVSGGYYRLQIRRLQLNNILAADYGGTSDPYLCFYTSPRGLLETPGIKTEVKYKVPGIGATGGAVWGERFRWSSPKNKPSVCQWDELELPLLKVRCPCRCHTLDASQPTASPMLSSRGGRRACASAR